MDTNPNDHARTKSNSSVLKGNGDSKWETWIRICLSFALGVFSSAFFLGGKSRDITELMDWKNGLEGKDGKFAQYDAEFRRMDNEGTHKSHWTDDNQSIQIANNSAAIAELKRTSDARSEVINVITGKIERIDGELKDIKEAARK